MANIKLIFENECGSDIQDYEQTQAILQLMNELAKGRKSGETKGWLTLEDVEDHLGIADEK